MKIINKDYAYVQKIDIIYLKKINIIIPESIFFKIFSEYINENNKYEFIKFERPDEIKYFKNLDWIIDYNDIKNLTEEQIINMCHEIAKKQNNIADKYNNMNDKKKDKNENMIQKCKLLDCKMYSLRDALWYKQGHIKINMPEIIEKQDKKSLKKIVIN